MAGNVLSIESNQTKMTSADRDPLQVTGSVIRAEYKDYTPLVLFANLRPIDSHMCHRGNPNFDLVPVRMRNQ